MTQRDQSGERRAVRKMLRALKAAGWSVAWVWDGGAREAVNGTEAEVLDAVFAVDDCTVTVRRDGSAWTHGIYVVLGNADDGSEVIADHGYTEGDPDGFSALMDDIMGSLDGGR